MGRLNQRFHRGYSESAAIVIREALNNKQFTPTVGMTLADVNAAGFWNFDGVGAFDQALPAASYAINRQGQLKVSADPTGVANIDFGEYYNDDAIATDYPPQVLASRILRSEILVEYEMVPSVIIPSAQFLLIPFDPLTGWAAAAIAFQVNIVTPATYQWVEGTLAPGGIGAAFVSERDALCNRLKVSAVRVNANQKNFVCNWWDRTAGAMQTATLNWAGAGLGDQALLWGFQLASLGGLPAHSNLTIRDLQTSDQAITYGAGPA